MRRFFINILIILINQNGVFKEKEGRSGISHSGQDHFAISHDYDNDGYLDIMISSSFGVKLYKNNGLAEFVDMTQPSDLFINNPMLIVVGTLQYLLGIFLMKWLAFTVILVKGGLMIALLYQK